MNKPLEIKSTKVRKELDVAKDRAIAAKAFDVFEAELDDAMQARAVVPELLGRLDALEKALQRPVHVEATTKAPAQPKKQPNKIRASRVLALAAIAEARRFSKQIKHETTLAEYYPGDDNRNIRKSAERLLKSATSVGATVDAGWAAELTNHDIGEWVEPLRERSIWGQLMQAGVAIPLGPNQSLTMPMRGANAKGSLGLSFVGEKATIPVKSDVLGSIMFSRHKAALITVVSNELIAVSNPAVLDVIENDALDDMGLGFDGVLLDPANAALAGIRPASPWNGAPNQASAGTDIASIVADLAWLVATAATIRPRRPVLIMSNDRVQRLRMAYDPANGAFPFRDEVENGTIMGLPILSASHVPNDKVYIIDAADFAYWAETPIIDISQSATVVMVDDDGVAPTMADTNAVNDTGGSVHVSDAATTVPPSEVRSMLQTYSTAMRMVAPVTWGTMRTGTAAYVTGVSW